MREYYGGERRGAHRAAVGTAGRTDLEMRQAVLSVCHRRGRRAQHAVNGVCERQGTRFMVPARGTLAIDLHGRGTVGQWADRRGRLAVAGGKGTGTGGGVAVRDAVCSKSRHEVAERDCDAWALGHSVWKLRASSAENGSSHCSRVEPTCRVPGVLRGS